MFILTKWKAAALCRLQRLYAGLQGRWRGIVQLLFPRQDARQADKPEPVKTGPVKKGSLFRAWSRELGGIFPRGYLPLAGAYIFALVLLLAIFISRQGKTPFLELPGKVENQIESGLPVEEAGRALHETSDSEPGRKAGTNAGAGAGVSANLEMGAGAGTGAGTAGTAGTGAGTAGTAGTAGKEAQIETGAGTGVGVQTGGGTPAEELPAETPALGKTAEPLPQAASPLPAWQVCRPYGEYTSEKLPSGGRLHTLTRGINLTATPGAPVAALWDGRVSKIGGGDSSYSQFVVLEHSGGYVTFYGNLREVWVEEGGRVYRGEQLGLLPHFPPVEPGVAQAVSAAAPALQGETGGEGEVLLKTIFKGALGETETSAWPFEAGNPLLYLEVRQGNSYLDPLLFIGVRN